MSEFFAMGGYALYVWGAYGVTIVIIAAELVLLAARVRAARQRRGAQAAQLSEAPK